MTSPKPKLRWYQFSLRTLFVFVTLCAVACSWLAVKMRQAKEQREAVEAIRKLGGIVIYEHQCRMTIGPSGLPGPLWLRKLCGDDFFVSVVMVSLQGTLVKDAELEQVARVTQLGVLNLDGTLVTDASIRYLEKMTRLQILILDHTQVTDAGVKKLQQALPNCEISR
jgi:hypothetical protein